MASAFPKKTPTPRVLSRERLKSVTVLPSKFLKEKFLKVKKKASTGTSFLPRIGPLLQMRGTGQKSPSVPPKPSLFQVSPPEIVFQNFVADEVYEMALSVINNDKLPRLVKVSMERSPYFELVCANEAYHIMPPGVSSPVRIRFTPKKNKNYSHELVCLTAKERVIVPIRAIGAKAILNFPEQLDFSECPVKYSTEKTLLVHNVGNLEAHYQLSTQSPFSVVPAMGTLGAGDSMQVTVRFHPLTVGVHFGTLEVCCNQGEKTVHTNLYGEAADVDTVLSTNSLKVGKTFINTSNYTTMFIENRSNITAHFQWKTFPTEKDENEEKRRQCYLLQPLKEVSLENLITKENREQKDSCEANTALLSPMAQKEMAKVQEDPMLFSDNIFSIEPVEGKIGPNCWAKIKVTFKPLEALEYRSVAYCNISGHETRLPLRLRGQGQGPLVELSNRTLNLGNVFVNTPYIYEVKLINRGAVDAPFSYIHTTANVGYHFKFAPEEGIIAPNRIQIIQISFNATTLGKFEEEFQFSVAGSPRPAILTIRGSVTRPNLHFNVDELNFGDISFGFPYTKTCRLTNCSPVPLTFKLHVSDDGTQPAVSSFDQICNDSDPSWRDGIHFFEKPREFTINPSQGTILPQEHQDIEVTLCSNSAMTFYQRILVDLEGISYGVASLIITARCLVPELRVYPQILLYDECRLKTPYTRKFLVANNTDLPGCYGLIPQRCEEDAPVLYSSPKPCGIVQPHSIAEIPVTIEVQTLGKHCTRLFIAVFGDERNPRRPELRSTEELAHIYPIPRLIEFGRIPALQPNSQSFTLFNEGPVPTDFRIEVACKPHCYVIEPREGVIPASSEVPVTITATLDDTGVFADTIHLFTGNHLRTAFVLVALGTGTTIVIDKPFAPELNLGQQFRLLPCHHQFKVTNRGHHFHRLFWSVECRSPPEKEGQSVSGLSSPKAKDDCLRPKRTGPVFELEPPWMELQPGESADVVLRGFSRTVQEVQDYLMCEADFGTARRMEKIIETTITCKFIDPSIEISARQISFRVEKKPSDDLVLQYKPLALTNTCSLPLDLMLDLEKPFLVCDVDQQPLPDGKPVTVDVGQTCHLYIAFDPAYELDLNSWKEKKLLKINMVNGHPYVEHVSLRGEAHFPNLQIQPSFLEFGCILAGTKEARCLQMTNCSPLPVQYHWSFHLDSHVNKFKYGRYSPKFKPQPPKEKRTSLDCSVFHRRRFRIRSAEDPALRESWDPPHSLGAEVLPYTWEKQYIPLGLGGFRLPMDVPCIPLEVEKAFSILPQSGVLQPGERQRVSFIFSGHLDTMATVTALCHVEGGPTYDVELTGEASCISYSLSLREIDCGCQIFNEIHHSRVTLANTGKIKFSWVLNLSTAEQHLPGMFLVKPTRGSIAPGEKQVLKFSYMLGVLGPFSRTFQLRVGDLDLETICLKGEAVLPMIAVKLPWNVEGNEKYEKLIKPQQQCSQKKKSVVRKKTQSPETETLKTQNLKSHKPGSSIVPNTQLQIKMVMMLVEEATLELQKKFLSCAPNSRFPDEELCQSLVKVELPEYVLDMGTVRKGYTETRTLAITNPGQIPVSFQADVSALQNSGFKINLDQMQGLPNNDTIMFEVNFESTHQPRGDVDVLVPIEVAKGPTYNIRLRATVLELALNLSKDTLQFSDILAGQCQVETVQLFNWLQAPCKWFIKGIEPVKKHKQRKYWTPARRRKQQALKDEPFEVTPSKGTLDPGGWQNLQIQFTPKEQRSYKNELKLKICGSSYHLKLDLSGQGLESRLEFSPPALQMGWVLMDSNGLEATVAVKNPRNFPVEFYSLDFDEQYLEEEKILRMAVGSEYQKDFLMLPRALGGMLPPEVLEDCEEQKRLKSQWAELKATAEAMAEAMDTAAPAYHGAVAPSPEPMVEVTGSPVSQAEMRHLGIDPSSERCEAQDRGIVFIIHGPPRTGKTEVAAALCHYYDAAHLSIDTVVKEAIASDHSQAGCRARELCTNAAMELKSEDEGHVGKKPLLTAQTKNKQVSRKKSNKKNAKGKNLSAPKKKKPASKPNKKDTKFTVSTAPAPQQLNIISSHGEELNCLSCVLPEDLLVDILCERLKREDCYKGVVFDGLESLFASSLESSLLCVYQAVKNHRHIYMVNLHQDYASWKAKEEDEREKGELQWKKYLQRSTEGVLQMDEDDALLEKKTLVDKIILEKKCTQTERELKQLAQKLEEEAKALEKEEKRKEEERRKEEEKWKKKKKDVSLEKQPAKPEKKESKSPVKETKIPEKKETKILEAEGTIIQKKWKYKALKMQKIIITEKGKPKAPGKGEPKAPKKREPKAPEKKKTDASEKGETQIPDYSAEMEKRFQIYKSLQEDITQVLDDFDGIQVTVQLPVIQNGNTSQPLAEKKGQKTNKPQEKVEKKPEQEKVEKKPEQKSGGQRSLLSSQLETQSEVAEGSVRDEHVGVLCLDIQITNPKTMIREILSDRRLPTKDEMLRHLGLHPEGPPLPPATVFSVVHYSEEGLDSAEPVKPFTIAALEGAAVEDNLVKSPINDIFKLHPATMSIPSSSNAVATVTFTPVDQQNASFVIPKSSVKTKPQTLTFTNSGKGHEPQVTVECPSARSKRGNAVLRFKRLRVGDLEMLPLVIRNNGIIPVKLMLHLEDEHGAFLLKGRAATLSKFCSEDVKEYCVGNESKPPKKPSLLLHHGQSAKFDVFFQPTLAQRLEGKIHVLVRNIYSDKTLIELVGEGHKDEFTLDGLEEDTEERNAKSSLNKDIIDAVRVNHIQFGDCPVGRSYRRTFTITNHTTTKVILFKWEADATFQFFPKAGDIYPGCAKDITVTLKSDVPAVFRRHLVKCKVTKINFVLPQRKVQDWEDRMCIDTWQDITRKEPAASWPKKEKMLQTALEPPYTVDDSSQEAEVYLSAFVTHPHFKQNAVMVQLKDTLPNQTRTATFKMPNTGNVALEYSWMEAADSEAVKKQHSTTLMDQLLSSATLRHHRKLLHHFWWQQEDPFETHPSELWQLAEQQHQPEQQQQDSEQQQPKHQQDSGQQQQDSEQPQDSEQQQQDSEQPQDSEKQQQQQQDSEQQEWQSQQQEKKSEKKQPKHQQDSGQQQQQDSEQPQDSEQQQQDYDQPQDSEQQQQDSEQQEWQSQQQEKKSEKQQPKQQQDSEQQQQQDSEQLQDSEKQQQQQQDSEQQEWQSQQQEKKSEKQQPKQPQDSEQQQQQQQQPKQQDREKKLRCSEQKHLSLQRVSSSLEIFPDVFCDLPLFSINSYHGIVALGQKQMFHILFSPKYAGKFRSIMLFRTPNLKPALKKAEVSVKGRAQEQECPDKPKRSTLRQTEKGQGPKKQAYWKPALE